MWFSPIEERSQERKKGEGGREGCNCDQGEGHIATSPSQPEPEKEPRAPGSSSKALPSECQRQHVLTWEDRLMEESHTEAEPDLRVPSSLGDPGVGIFSLSPIPRRIIFLESIEATLPRTCLSLDLVPSISHLLELAGTGHWSLQTLLTVLES